MSSLFFRISAKRLIAVAVLALVVGAVTGAIIYSKPATYRAEAVIFTRQLFPQGIPNYELAPIADDVVSTMTTTSVVSAASRASRLPQSTIQSNLDVSRIEATGNVEVVFRSTSGSQATKVVETTSRETLRSVANSDLRKAQAAAQQAQNATDTAVNRLAAFRIANGGASDDSLAGEVSRTQNALATARGREDEARTEVTAADSDAIVAVRTPTQTSRLTDTLRGVVSAVVIAAALGLMVLVLLDRGRRRPIGELEPGSPMPPDRAPAIVGEPAGVGRNADSEPAPTGIHWRPEDTPTSAPPNGGPTRIPRATP